jgi:GR25 family glycosyltransferase involved in LPS biosynthesis
MFSKILYINLDRRPDRKENVESQLKDIRYKGPVERISAIDAKKLDFNIIPKTFITPDGIKTATSKETPVYTYLTKGGIGCAFSHKRVFEQILYGQDEYVLILEDDIWFDKQFSEKLTKALEKIPDYDILWLGYHTKSNVRSLDDFDVPDKLYGLFGYIINKKAASKLLDIFPITWQIDSEIPKMFPSLRVYALKEQDRIVFSEPSQVSYAFGTDIQHREDFLNIQSEQSRSIKPQTLLILMLIFGIVYYIYKK